MFRIIQIDPDTLAIRINASALAAHEKKDIFFEFLDLYSLYGPIRALDIVFSNHGFDYDIIELASSLIHEIRHFGDLLLTPFGFYRVRTAFEFYINFPKMFFVSDDPIPIPLMSAMDPITRYAIGIPEGFESNIFHQIGRTAFSRVGIINSENIFDESSGNIKIGADRILEGLAYITQFEFIYRKFDRSHAEARFTDFFSDFTGTSFDFAYRWFTPVVHELHPGESMPNNRLIQSILFASLCGSIPVLGNYRIGEIQPKIIPERDISEQLPSVRYFKLIEYFKSSPRASLLDDKEAFDLVDKACIRLFGKDLFTEIEYDIDYTDYFIQNLSLAVKESSSEFDGFNASIALRQMNKYRRDVYGRFRKDPTLFSSVHRFAEETTEFLKPSIIYDAPQGLYRTQKFPSVVRSKWISLVDRQIERPEAQRLMPWATDEVVYSMWCPMQGELGYNKGLCDIIIIEDENRADDSLISSLQKLYGIYAPLYRWLLYGNKFRSMIEVESDDIMKALGFGGRKVIYDPLYELSLDISTPDVFMRFFRRKTYVCDVCGKEIENKEACIVSSRTIRQSFLIRKYFEEMGDNIAYEHLKKDWSDWLVCHEDLRKFEIPIAK